MRIGIFLPTIEQGPVEQMVEAFRRIADEGFDSGWLPQSTGYDALTLLAVIGSHVPGIALGTSVVPTYPRHPMVLAAQALTTNAAVGGRLELGLGLSHAMAIEGRYGLSYARPGRHMREYLSVLLPAMREGEVAFEGETLVGRGQLSIPEPQPCPVLLAALQPTMLRLAGGMADGTITWCTGPITVREQIVPLISKAAVEAGRPAPRVVVALPVCVTDDPADGRQKADQQLAGYGQIPVYRAVLDREGVESPGDVSVVGGEVSVTDQIRRFEEMGATDFVAILCGTDQDRLRTRELLRGLS
jgi:F420-dependent oxidoreductase-like protein